MPTSRRNRPSATTDDVPNIGQHRPRFRTVLTEVQRETIAGGWVTVAVADNADWAGTIAAALGWLEANPVLSEAG